MSWWLFPIIRGQADGAGVALMAFGGLSGVREIWSEGE
jgi:hypothetical protein